MATATVGATVVGQAYGTAADERTLALDLKPLVTLSGSALDENGAALSGAAVVWDFDPSFSTVSGGGGAWTLPPSPSGLGTEPAVSAHSGHGHGYARRLRVCQLRHRGNGDSGGMQRIRMAGVGPRMSSVAVIVHAETP